MKRVGNVASNRIYNPKNTRPPIPFDADEADSAMERFIRQKYQEKAATAPQGTILEAQTQMTNLHLCHQSRGTSLASGLHHRFSHYHRNLDAKPPQLRKAISNNVLGHLRLIGGTNPQRCLELLLGQMIHKIWISS